MSFPAPRDPVLADALDRHARDYAARHGWDRLYLSRIRSGIRLLLGLQHTPGAAITTSEAAVLADVQLPIRDVIAVLAEVGMHHEDRPPPLERSFQQRVLDAALPELMTAELRIWFEVMSQGSTTPPRRRHRSPITIRLHTTRLLPVLRAWADAGHSSLREITRDHIVAALPSSGRARTQLGQALRSLFGILKARKVIFGDPTGRLRTWVDAPLQPRVLDLNQVRAALRSDDPARAALTALAAFHGLRSGQLSDLKTTDVRDGRLFLEERTILLAAPAIARVAAWLKYRQTRWPDSTSPYLFVSSRTSGRNQPVSHRWIKLTIDIPGSAAALRSDRIFHETNATQGDIRRLCDLFGLSVTAATRYANTLGHPDLRGEAQPD